MYLNFILLLFGLIMVITNGSVVQEMQEDGLQSTQPTVRLIRCHVCSWAGGNNRNCLFHPDPQVAIPCNRSCMLHEQWNHRTKKLMSILRTCNKPMKNECIKDWTNVNCQSHCEHDYCNDVIFDGNHTLDFRCFNYNCDGVNSSSKSAPGTLFKFILFTIIGYLNVYFV